MFRYVASLAVLLASVASAFCAAPKVPGIVLATTGKPTVVEIESPAAGVAVAWREAFHADSCFVGEMKPLRADTIRLLFIPHKPGLYSVVAWAGKEREDSALLVLDATGSPPEVIPDKKKEPDVIPPPPPKTVVEGKQFVVVIQDRLRADVGSTTALASNEFREWLRAGGHELEVIDTSTEAGLARAAKYRAAFAAFKVPEGTPVLLLQAAEARGTTPRGWVGAMVKLPTATPDLLSTLKTLTGK